MLHNGKARFLGKGEGENRRQYFCILNDHLDGYKATEEEKKKAKKFGLTDFFQLFDDDGILYYSGYANFDLMYEYELDEFTILDMAMADSGCTEIKTRNKEGKMETV
jgi:hypothetical protein